MFYGSNIRDPRFFDVYKMKTGVWEPEMFYMNEEGLNLTSASRDERIIALTKSIPPWWGSFRDALCQEMGDPYSEDSVRLYNVSPLFHADRVKKPIRVVQGANDPRVLQINRMRSLKPSGTMVCMQST